MMPRNCNPRAISTAVPVSDPGIRAGAGPRSGHVAIAIGMARSPITAKDAQMSGRQRGDGGRPSGKSRTASVTSSVNPGAHTHKATQAITSANGSEPGTTDRP